MWWVIVISASLPPGHDACCREATPVCWRLVGDVEYYGENLCKGMVPEVCVNKSNCFCVPTWLARSRGVNRCG